MATVEFDLRGAGKIPAEHKAIAEATDVSTKAQAKLGTTWKSTAAEAQKADRLLKDILKRNETDQQKYNRKLLETKKALAGVVGETELLAKETSKLRIELLKAQDANPKLAAQRKRDADAAIAEAKREAAERVRLGRTAAAELEAFDRRYTAQHKAQVNERIRDIQNSERAHGRFLTTLNTELKQLPDLIDPMTAALGEWTEDGESLATSIGDIGDKSDTAFGSVAVGRIAAWGASLVTVHAVLKTITEEIRLQQELIDKQAALRMSVSESRNVLGRNLGSKSDAEVDRAKGLTRRLAEETGVSEVAINLGMANAVTASGGDIDVAFDATRMATKFLPDKASEIGEYAGSLVDLGKASGTFNAEVNQGLQGAIGEVGRVVDPGQQARNIAPALIGTLPYGGDAQTAGALFGALSNASGDVRGDVTKTAVTRLAEQLDLFEPVKALPKLNQKIFALQTIPGLADKFFAPASEGGGGASFDAQLKGPIRQLLTDRGSFAAKQYWKNLDLIGDNATMAQLGRRSVEVLDFNELNSEASLDRRFDSTVESIQLSKPQMSLTTQQRERLREIDIATGSSATMAGWSDWWDGLGDGQPGMSLDSGIGALQRMRRQVIYPYDERNAAVFNKGEQQTVAAIDRLEAELKAQSDISKQQLKVMEKIATGQQEGGGLVGTAE